MSAGEPALPRVAGVLGESRRGGEFGGAVEPVGERLACRQHFVEDVTDGPSDAAAVVDQPRVDAVAGSEEAVLLEQLRRNGRVRGRLSVASDQTLDERGERRGVLNSRLGVEDADLDGAETRP